MESEKKSHGALIGSIIIIIILIIGGIYIWQSKMKNVVGLPETPTPITSDNTADELNTLEQDINSTDTSTGVDVNSIQ
ncbi:MAG: hypothetical protein WA101_01280 [Minisyncoccia bacterium]